MPPTRAEESRLQVRTLAIAALAALVAALVTSRFWIAGTPIAAALTPVIVTIVSELLHRPTEAIARRVTTERTALLPEAMGAGAPEDQADEPARPARDLEGRPSEVRVYRPERRRWGRIHPKVVAVTAILAFAIAAAALTLPELIAGESIGKGRGTTSLFSGDGDDADEPKQEQEEQPQEQTTPDEETPPADTQPEEETPTTEEPTPTTEEPTTTVPTVPQEVPPVEP